MNLVRIKHVVLRYRGSLSLGRLKQNVADSRLYQESFRTLNESYVRRHDLAVVVHVYYPESWPHIKDKLQQSLGDAFDLFITLPEHNTAFAKTITAEYPESVILITPNRGRDILPFLRVAERLQTLGYMHLLKLHTKKSTHRTDGADWFNDLLSNLLPRNPKVLKALMATLNDKDTGIVGPADQYMQLTVNFEANGARMTQLLNKLYSKDTTHNTLQLGREDHGFFCW